jgi:steroid 5-alpha reductase family enzyme
LDFFFESVGDLQLAHFKANFANQGKVTDGGVWHYTCRPKYFGKSAWSWGYYLIAVFAGGW